MQDLKDELKSSFKLTFVEELDQREVGGSGFVCKDQILEKVKTLLERVSQVSVVSPSFCFIIE